MIALGSLVPSVLQTNPNLHGGFGVYFLTVSEWYNLKVQCVGFRGRSGI